MGLCYYNLLRLINGGIKVADPYWDCSRDIYLWNGSGMLFKQIICLKTVLLSFMYEKMKLIWKILWAWSSTHLSLLATPGFFKT